MSVTRPKVIMIGLRGFPDIQGGIERHVESLAPLLVERGWDVEVLGREPYLPETAPKSWHGVTITPLWAPRHKSLEAILHTAIAVLVARLRSPQIVHIHAIGPSLLVPFARLLGLTVVVTHHGYDYDRGKWGRMAKAMLKLGERFGMRWANGRIAVSGDIARTMQMRYGVPVHFVPNGVTPPVAADAGILRQFGLTVRRYVVLVARLVPEKRQLDLIAAYRRLDNPDFKLVLVGGADHRDAYADTLDQAAAGTPGVVMTGVRTGVELAGLLHHAGLFVLPSSHEGMPIALLEALAHGLPVLASDIVPNFELHLADEDYFPLGDIKALATSMAARMAIPFDDTQSAQRSEQALAKYGWSHIADETLLVYRNTLASPAADGKRLRA